jgi:hypothetical protein
MILLARLGLLLGLVANGALGLFWSAWSGGPWADCPNHPFGASWYLAPPVIVLLVPFFFSALGLLCAALSHALSRQAQAPRPSVVQGISLALNTLPILLASALPCASDLLHLTTRGC